MIVQKLLLEATASSLDTQRVTILLRCLTVDSTLEAFRGVIMGCQIPNDYGLTLKGYSIIAEFFGIERIEIIDGTLIIPVASMNTNIFGNVDLIYDDKLFDDPELILVESTPEMEYRRCVRIILQHQLPVPIPSYIKVYCMKNNVITDYDDYTDYDCLLVDSVSAMLYVPYSLVPRIMLRRPFENQDEKQFEVIDTYTVMDRPAAYLKESDITFKLPLIFAIKQDGQMILSGSFNTITEVLRIISLKMLYGGASMHTLSILGGGKYKVPLGLFFMDYYVFSSPTSTLEFVNGNEHPFEIRLVCNPSRLLSPVPLYTDLYVDNDVLILTDMVPSDSDGDPVYVHKRLMRGTKINHYYMNVANVGLKANMAEYFSNVVMFNESGESMNIDYSQLQQVGDRLILPAEAKYLMADHRYVEPLFYV